MMVNTPFLLLAMPGGWELMIIVLVVLLLFGAKKIPELARGMGRGIREFKEASREIKKEIESEADELKKLDQENS
ncbi:MAG: twin-arginine translocase TatA/TatE family subunit [Bacteroidetes bacterium]|nr:MAG: twin-arginine translocase TatA/TatE family subunit [Bacteroidota bacterium]